MLNYIDFFADFVLQFYEFNKFDPNDIAIAIIICVRKNLQINPLWNN